MKKEFSNILVVHNKYKIRGGEDSVVENEVKLLRDAGYNVILYIRSNEEIDKLSKFKKVCLAFSSAYSKKTYKEIREIIVRESIDIVHVHNTLTVITPSVYYAALDANIPVIQTIHNFRLICPGALLLRNGKVCEECITQGLSRSIKHKCYHQSRLQSLMVSRILKYNRKREVYRRIYYICLTEFNRKKLLCVDGVFNQNNIFIKPNFASECNAVIPFENRAKCFTCLSRLSEEKGVLDLIDVWEKINVKLPEFKLIICGDGPQKSEIEAKIINRNINGVELKGTVDHYEAIGFLKNSYGLLFPSKWYEGFPMVIVESFACGTPIICSDIGNASDIVKDGVLGYKIKSDIRIADKWAECIEKYVFLDHKKLDELSSNCLNEYEKKYSPKVNLGQLEEIYGKIICCQKSKV